MRKRQRHLGGTTPNHVNIAEGFIKEADRLLAKARSCRDLAYVKSILGGAQENLIWAKGKTRTRLEESYAEVNHRVNSRLALSCGDQTLGRSRRAKA